MPLFAGCERDDAADVVGAEEDLRGPNSASDGVEWTVALHNRRDSSVLFTRCSATVIANNAVLTAAHCLTEFQELDDLYVIGRDAVPVARVMGCAVHPLALTGQVVPDCSAVVGQNVGSVISARHDLAVLTFNRPLALPARTLAPPHLCSERVDPEELVARGFASGSDLRRLVALGQVIATGTLRTTYLDTEDFIDHGDSGGGWTEEARDRDGPIVAVTSTLYEGVHYGDMTFLWTGEETGFGRNADWIWSAIADTPGTCVLGPRSDADTLDPAPPCFVHGVEQLDSDHDGLPDHHDLCPHLDGRLRLRAPRTTDTAVGVTGQHQDEDGDFVGDDCDPYEGVCNWTDRDHDSVPDELDNCPDDSNVDQANCDRADRGDACEDDDQDGRTDVCGRDNCPPDPALPALWRTAYNPDQHDCNEDAERAAASALRGDACDPTPCGDTVLETRDVVRVPGESPRAHFRVHDQVWIDARSTNPQDARSGIRFCACPDASRDDVPERSRCQDEVGCAIEFHSFGLSESRTQPWRRTTLAYGPNDSGTSPPLRPGNEAVAHYVAPSSAACSVDSECQSGASCIDARCSATSFQRDLIATWQQRVDYDRWVPIYDAPTTADTPGVLWTHTPGRSDASLFPDAVRALSSHYWSGSVAPRRALFLEPLPGPVLAPFIGLDLCLECESSFPGPFISLDDAGDPWIDIRGSLIDGGAFFGTLPIGDLSLKWVPAVEPEEWLDTAPLRYVALDPQGTLLHAAVQTGAGFADVSPCGPNGCPTLCNGPGGCVPPAATFAATAAPTPAPEPGIMVLSATAATLFVVGATDGTSARSVFALPVPASGRTPIDLGSFALGRVLAATYSPSARALYVVDYVGTREREARLSRISTAGVAVELARWRRVARTTRLAIAEAPDGTLYLAASGDRAEHVVLRIEPHATPPRILGVAHGRGPLGSPYVRASRLGISLIAGDGRAAAAIGYLGADFRRPRARDLDECF